MLDAAAADCCCWLICWVLPASAALPTSFFLAFVWVARCECFIASRRCPWRRPGCSARPRRRAAEPRIDQVLRYLKPGSQVSQTRFTGISKQKTIFLPCFQPASQVSQTRFTGISNQVHRYLKPGSQVSQTRFTGISNQVLVY